jgi:hypothetical protein
MEKIMATLRQKINGVTNKNGNKLLRDNEVISENGNLTALGMRILADILFKDEDNRQAVVDAVKKAVSEE